VERTFRSGESFNAADVSRTEMQYTYKNGNALCFMNMETFEEQQIDQSKFENVDLLVEGMRYSPAQQLFTWYATDVESCTYAGMSCDVSMWKEQVINVQMPQQMVYTVADTPPNFKGNTATAALKPAKLDSGATVNVPMFIEIGEKIIVSTADGKYVSRASSS
jgi:elongation factor P